MTNHRTPTPEQFVGSYGPKWKQGVLSEHLHAAAAVGIEVRYTASGGQRAVLPDGSSFRVVCSEVILLHTEDGLQSGRCGSPVSSGEDHFCCDAHSWVEDEARRPLEDRWAEEGAAEDLERRGVR